MMDAFSKEFNPAVTAAIVGGLTTGVLLAALGWLVWRWQQRRWRLEKERGRREAPADVETALRVATAVTETATGVAVRAAIREIEEERERGRVERRRVERRSVSEGDWGDDGPMMSGALGSAPTGLAVIPERRRATIPEGLRGRKTRKSE
ncbi:hypothetical protein K469DRAFT_686594 [Zopfia rhizophila CBS 207.26]|uniref:Uncharacterized protein n=1 Tax=Zopfia rhizophila CBS 207.26 TaxID=1314779 RepID=A0A6A6ESP3_9PEZI|nr:hypothetical protein K469DRAFT_686594 [Zopfia rhizophila CBS 207.26]